MRVVAACRTCLRRLLLVVLVRIEWSLVLLLLLLLLPADIPCAWIDRRSGRVGCKVGAFVQIGMLPGGVDKLSASIRRLRHGGFDEIVYFKKKKQS